MTQRLLFQKLPVSLFVSLVTSLAELYADVLLRLFITTQQHRESLSWELCISLIVEVIEDRENTEQLALWGEASPEEGVNASQDTRSRATRNIAPPEAVPVVARGNSSRWNIDL